MLALGCISREGHLLRALPEGPGKFSSGERSCRGPPKGIFVLTVRLSESAAPLAGFSELAEDGVASPGAWPEVFLDLAAACGVPQKSWKRVGSHLCPERSGWRSPPPLSSPKIDRPFSANFFFCVCVCVCARARARLRACSMICMFACVHVCACVCEPSFHKSTVAATVTVINLSDFVRLFMNLFKPILISSSCSDAKCKSQTLWKLYYGNSFTGCQPSSS